MTNVSGYQRFLAPGFKPFDPLELAKETEKLIAREGPNGLERKYTGFYSVPVYRGIATGYAVGCCLRCVYCWSDWSRDFPEAFGNFYSPAEVAENLLKAAERGITYSDYWRYRIPKIRKLRLSGCEPTLVKGHFLSILERVQGSNYPFYLETNGILLGADRDYVKKLSEFSDFIYVRVSFKAATPEAFTARTGAIGKYYELPFKALRYLLDEGVFAMAAAMTDPRIMPNGERRMLIEMLSEVDPMYERGGLEEEVMDPYDTSIERLRASVNAKYARDLEAKVRHNILKL